MLQGVKVCCSVLQDVAVCCSVLQRVAMCCRVLQGVAVRCSMLQCVAVRCIVLQGVAVRYTCVKYSENTPTHTDTDQTHQPMGRGGKKIMENHVTHRIKS